MEGVGCRGECGGRGWSAGESEVGGGGVQGRANERAPKAGQSRCLSAPFTLKQS